MAFAVGGVGPALPKAVGPWEPASRGAGGLRSHPHGPHVRPRTASRRPRPPCSSFACARCARAPASGVCLPKNSEGRGSGLDTRSASASLGTDSRAAEGVEAAAPWSAKGRARPARVRAPGRDGEGGEPAARAASGPRRMRLARPAEATTSSWRPQLRQAWPPDELHTHAGAWKGVAQLLNR